MTAILNEYEAFLTLAKRQTSPAGLIAKEKNWRHTKVAQVNRSLGQRLAIERWRQQQQKAKDVRNSDRKVDRVQFFEHHAGALEPPLSESALQLIGAYQDSVKIPKMPSERSWTSLRPKLEETRLAAEALATQESQALQANQQGIYQSLQTELWRRNSAEQRFVLRLADGVLVRLKPHLLQGHISVQCFILLALRSIWACYGDIPLHQRPRSTLPRFIHANGIYALTMDDALMVVDRTIMPALRDYSATANEEATKLKCPGCSRSDVHSRFSFAALLAHILDVHAHRVGDFQCFRKAGWSAPFTWFAVPWPKNIPALAEHQESTGKWNPEDDTPFEFAPTMYISQNPAQSAFEGRTVSCASFGAATGDQDFVSRTKEAALMLRDSPIDASFRAKIVLEYSLRRYKRWALRESPWFFPIKPSNSSCTPDFAVWEDLMLALIRIGDFDLFNNLRCKACKGAAASRKAASKFGQVGHTRTELVHHYKVYSKIQSDHSLDSWTANMFDLPNDKELMLALSKREMESTRLVFDKLFPYEDVSAA